MYGKIEDLKDNVARAKKNLNQETWSKFGDLAKIATLVDIVNAQDDLLRWYHETDLYLAARLLTEEERDNASSESEIREKAIETINKCVEHIRNREVYILSGERGGQDV